MSKKIQSHKDLSEKEAVAIIEKHAIKWLRKKKKEALQNLGKERLGLTLQRKMSLNPKDL
jgi:hypothetical protein